MHVIIITDKEGNVYVFAERCVIGANREIALVTRWGPQEGHAHIASPRIINGARHNHRQSTWMILKVQFKGGFYWSLEVTPFGLCLATVHFARRDDVRALCKVQICVGGEYIILKFYMLHELLLHQGKE